MKPIKLILLLIGLLLVFISLTSVFYLNFMIEDVVSVPYNFRVEARTAGLDAGTDQLGFGTIPLGGSSERSLILSSDKDAQVLITTYGDGSELIHTNGSFYIAANENKTLFVSVIVPDNVEEKEYEGRLTAIFYRDIR